MTTTDPGPTTYRVHETPVQTSRHVPRRTIAAGHSPAGVHLALSPEAAERLADLLMGTTISDLELLRDHLDEAGGADPDLWAHVALDLLKARARHLHAADRAAAYVDAGSHQSGYLRPVRTTTQGDHQ